MSKKNFLLMLFFVMLLGVAAWGPKEVQAANPTHAKLSVNRIYRNYDITGDRKADNIRFILTLNPTRDYYTGLSVVINGKTAYKFSNEYYYGGSVQASIYTLKNGKPFLYLFAPSDNGDGPVNGVFQYKNGKLNQVINFQTIFGKYGMHQGGRVMKVTGNTIYTENTVMSYSLGSSTVRFKYSYQGGTLKRTGNTAKYYKIYAGGKNTRKFYANKSLAVYTSVNTKTRAFTVKKGAAVTVDRCYTNGKKMLIHVTCSGNQGWIKAGTFSTSVDNSKKQFSNVTYAG